MRRKLISLEINFERESIRTSKSVKTLLDILGGGKDRKGQTIKTHCSIKCEAFVLILPLEEYKRRTSDDEILSAL